MNTCQKLTSREQGFTLIELLIVILIIATLAVLVFVALNPVKRLQDTRNVRRQQDAQSLYTAIHEYAIDRSSLPFGLTAGMQETQIGTSNGSGTSGNPTCAITTSTCNAVVSSCINLSGPLASYLTFIPTDPLSGSPSATGYTVTVDTNNLVTIKTCRTEGSVSMPYVSGNSVYITDVSGHKSPLHFRGTQIPSVFNSGTWNNGTAIATTFTLQAFNAITSWKMNILRIPVAAYRYQLTNYMMLLDQVVQQANQAGLYVVLANFEDNRAGMGSVGNGLLDAKGLSFWQYIAQHYAGNPMVMYDLINEPKNVNYNDWLNGNVSGVVGMQQAVNAIRSAGGNQIIIAEAIDQAPYFSGFTSFITDQNIMYSMHNYFKTTALRTQSGANSWDSYFGNLAASYPMYIGEWAFLPNANYPSFCSGLDAISGTALVNQFMNYMDQKNINWSGWAFTQYHFVQDTTTFAPTFLQSPNEDGCCGLGPSASCNFGMGTVVNQYLSSH